MLLFVVRACFAAVMIGIALFAFNLFEQAHTGQVTAVWYGAAGGGAVLLAGAVVLFLDVRGGRKNITDISAVFFGLTLGLLVGWLFSEALRPYIEAAFDPLDKPKLAGFLLLIRTTLVTFCCYLAVATLVQTKDDFRFVIPYVEFARQVRGGRPLVLDTSVIIDGRIADLCDTRLVDARLVVPRFVLLELQAVADSSDRLKRNRGRRGLDVLKRLQANPKVELVMDDTPADPRADRPRVDERLVLFAKAVGGRVVTNDFNLNKVAQLQGVDVINLNEVAAALRAVALPGEVLTVRMMKNGEQPGQAVGYLSDGTMVVVEQARAHIGTDIPVLVTSVLQTPNGRMIFGRPDAPRPSGTFPPVPSGSSGTHSPVPAGGLAAPNSGPGSGGLTADGRPRKS